jgi:predicted alpha/beta hydrolase
MTPVPFHLTGGARNTARLFEGNAALPPVLVLPAMSVNARAYDKLGAALAARGHTTLAAEMRGGESSNIRARRGVDYGYADLVNDAMAHIAWLRARHPVVHVLGHSLGGQIAVLGSARWVVPGAKLVLAASGTPYWRGQRGAASWKTLVLTLLSNLLARTLGYFPGHWVGYGGLQGQQLVVEGTYCGRTGNYHAVTEQGITQAALPLLALHVQGDRIIPPGSTRELLGKLPHAQVTTAFFAAPAEPAAQDTHFRWLRQPEMAADMVAEFLHCPDPA